MLQNIKSYVMRIGLVVLAILALATFGNTSRVAAATTATHDAATSIEVNPANEITDTESTVQYTATATDQNGVSWDATSEVAWSTTDPTGTVSADGLYNPGQVGNWNIEAVIGLVSGVTNVTVAHDVATSISISPTTATITADDTQAYEVTASDAYGNSWLVGSIDGVDFEIVEIDHAGAWLGNVYTAAKAGAWTVQVTYQTLTAQAQLIVEHGEVADLTINPADVHLSNADQVQDYTVLASDAYGNSWDATSEVAWSTTDPAGTFIGNQYNPARVGTWEIIAQSGEVKTTTNVIIDNPGVPKSLEMTNSVSEIEIDTMYQFTVIARDADGNVVEPVIVDWSVTFGTGAGIIDANGNFVGTKAGTVAVVAKTEFAEIVYSFTVKQIADDSEESGTTTATDSDSHDEANNSTSDSKPLLVSKVLAADSEVDSEESETEPSDENGKIMGTEIETIGASATTDSNEPSSRNIWVSLFLALVILAASYYGYNYFGTEDKLAAVEVPVKRKVKKPEVESEIKSETKTTSESSSSSTSDTSDKKSSEDIQDIPKQDDDSSNNLRW